VQVSCESNQARMAAGRKRGNVFNWGEAVVLLAGALYVFARALVVAHEIRREQAQGSGRPAPAQPEGLQGREQACRVIQDQSATIRSQSAKLVFMAYVLLSRERAHA
jgi:hypothetical protein